MTEMQLEDKNYYCKKRRRRRRRRREKKQRVVSTRAEVLELLGDGVGSVSVVGAKPWR
jgi:hypothetical protein